MLRFCCLSTFYPSRAGKLVPPLAKFPPVKLLLSPGESKEIFGGKERKPLVGCTAASSCTMTIRPGPDWLVVWALLYPDGSEAAESVGISWLNCWLDEWPTAVFRSLNRDEWAPLLMRDSCLVCWCDCCVLHFRATIQLSGFNQSMVVEMGRFQLNWKKKITWGACSI